MALNTPKASSVHSRASESAVKRGGSTSPTTLPKSDLNSAANLRELLHAPVVGEALHFERGDAAIAGGEQDVLEQDRADTMALPLGLDAEGRFGFVRERRGRPQLRSAAQGSIEEKAVHDRPEVADAAGMLRNKVVTDRAGEAAVPAVGIEPQQMIAVGLGFAGPKLADDAARGKKVMHGRVS